MSTDRNENEASVKESIYTLSLSAFFLLTGIFVLKLPLGLSFLFLVFFVSWFVHRQGYSIDQIKKGVLKGITLVAEPIIIVVFIGMLIGCWVGSGTISAMIFYGLDLVHYEWFLVTSCLLCVLTSLIIGSSWTTVATIGIALIGIGDSLQLPLPLVAGAIISGAFFGDKLSPLSETTNLAAAITDTPLMEHIKSMLFTTVPALVIALIIYMFLGFSFVDPGQSVDARVLTQLKEDIENIQVMSFWLLLPTVLVLGMSVSRMPILLSLSVGCVSSIILAIIFQNISIAEMLNTAYFGFTVESDNTSLSRLLNRGGITSFFEFIFILSCAAAFGGVIEVGQYPQTLLKSLVQKLKTARSVLVSSLFSTIGIIGLFGDTYLAIILPGKFFKEIYKEKGIRSSVLSRIVEDGGTSVTALIPWGAAGLFMTATLGVDTLEYVPYTFVCLLVPLISFLYGVTGTFIFKIKEKEQLPTN